MIFKHCFNHNTLFKQSKNYLDRDVDCKPGDVPVYTGHSLFNTTKRTPLLFIFQLLLHRNPPVTLYH